MLVKRAIKGDTHSLSELLRKHYSFLYQYSLKLTMNKVKAEDITQETMLKAIEKISTFQAESKFTTWLISIASRLVIDRARRSERENRWLQEEGELRSLRFEALIRMNDWPDALQALGELEERQRMAVLLKYYYGYSQEEIANMLDVPLGTVKSRLHAGIKQLRKELTASEEEQSS
ncbi:RNA polymerase sigma factor SigY [Paenibacillus sp. GSMTC-2017]|nr:RNA polymerase sigma factor SigY [Paenibacillus sp. GSMTC-2017]MBH5320159.1 RNA polymerase sigma factor SigY [Paenibacillus sp. GSMTC-2017]